jgi:hypothetical protein
MTNFFSIQVLPAPKVRLPDWQMRFAALVRERVQEPFVWGQHDCCLWAADCVLALTGFDPAQQLRGAYADERTAVRLVRHLGGMARIAQAALGAPVGARLANVGDVVLVTHTGQTILSVCNGATLLSPSMQGMQTHALPLACRTWKV